jgi:hypothetical protein
MRDNGGMRMPPFIFALPLLAAACSRAPQPAAPTPAPAHAHSSAHAAPAAAEMDPSEPMQEAAATVEGAFGTGAPVTVTLHVTDMMGSGAMGPARFQTVHEQKLHVLIADQSLSDYSHVHPEPISPEGDWRFSFTPKHDRPYRLWLDATPVGGKQYYSTVTINEGAKSVPVQRGLSMQAAAGDVEASLAFEQPPVAGGTSSGTVELRRGGQPLTALEPVMGTYGHIVGFDEDWEGIAHVHPLGPEPHAAGDRGGPTLRFHLEPRHPGFLKLHVQVRVDGRDLYLPFGIEVRPGK